MKVKMSLERAIAIVGNRPKWELQNMHRALASFQAINTEEENTRLEAVRTLLRHKKTPKMIIRKR